MPNAHLPQAFLDDLHLTADAYLTCSDPILQSGFGGGPERWRTEREPILNAVDRSGSLIDVGCANGYLVESLDIAAFLENAGFPVSGQVTVGTLPEARFAWIVA